MNVLVLAPVMSKELCEDYYTYTRLHEKGVKLAFITGRSLGARGNYMKLPLFENTDGIPIYRLYDNYRDFNEMGLFPLKKLKQVLSVANSLKPDLILCHLAENMLLALRLQKHLKIPIVLHVETASNIAKSKFIGGSWQTRFARVLIGQPIRGLLYWSWLCEKADALVTSEPRDQHLLHSLSKHGKPLYYLPWPARIPEDCPLPKSKNKLRAIYAGTLLPNKNTQELERIIPLILQETHTKEFVVIGSGSHESIIRKLKRQYGSAVIHIPALPRCEILKLIASSYYAFTPVNEGGWGFLGDCWGTKTPLLMLNNVFLSKTLDICVARSKDELVRKINRLYEDPLFYQQMQDVGYNIYKMRSADAVGDEFLSILQRTLEKNSISTYRGNQTFDTNASLGVRALFS
jgi:glycosyltransferase involved in cell wall biosynthesis